MASQQPTSAATLTIDSVTGVDVAMEIVGAGGRSYAFLIDWHIRALIALAWWLATSFIVGGLAAITQGEASDAVIGRYVVVVVLPALAIYLLYHPVLEVALAGRTPGKRMAGVRIVTREGAAPGVGAILIRNAFRLIDSLPVFYCVGLGVVLATRDHVRIGDLAAGTLLVYDRTRASRSDAAAFKSSATDPRVAELAQDALERWPELSSEARVRIALAILRRGDPGFASADEGPLHERLRKLAGQTS